jgi:hypothetical protein
MCVIAYININNEKILVKNRDRLYKPIISVIHEIINNIEVVYIYDHITHWVEGMNEHGIGLVNSALMIKFDESEGSQNIVKNSGLKTINIISKPLLKDAITSTINYTAKSKKPLQGHTIIGNENEIFHIEAVDKQNTIVNKINDKIFVATNHGLNTNSGYIKGRKRVSSLIRKKIIETELMNATNNNILELLNKNYICLDPRMSPYRDRQSTTDVLKNKSDTTKIFGTTCQLMLNLTKKEFHVNVDKNNGDFKEYVNNLPKNYIPKIKVRISFITKNTKPCELLLPQNDLLKINNQFGGHDKFINKYIKYKRKYLLLKEQLFPLVSSRNTIPN